jgi:hypothetical protein
LISFLTSAIISFNFSAVISGSNVYWNQQPKEKFNQSINQSKKDK